MTRARDLAAVAITLAWWSPSFLAAIIFAAPHIAARYGAPYRIRRAHRLIAGGRVDEADRVIRALQRDHDVADLWREALNPHRWGRS